MEKGESIPAKLDHYAIMTTGKVSGTAQLTIQQINKKHRVTGLFTVDHAAACTCSQPQVKSRRDSFVRECPK